MRRWSGKRVRGGLAVEGDWHADGRAGEAGGLGRSHDPMAYVDAHLGRTPIDARHCLDELVRERVVHEYCVSAQLVGHDGARIRGAHVLQAVKDVGCRSFTSKSLLDEARYRLPASRLNYPGSASGVPRSPGGWRGGRLASEPLAVRLAHQDAWGLRRVWDGSRGALAVSFLFVVWHPAHGGPAEQLAGFMLP